MALCQIEVYHDDFRFSLLWNAAYTDHYRRSGNYV